MIQHTVPPTTIATSKYLNSIATAIPWSCLGLPSPIWFLFPSPLIHIYGLSSFSTLIHSSLPETDFAASFLQKFLLNLKSPPIPPSYNSTIHSQSDWDDWFSFLPDSWLPAHINAPLSSFPTRHARVIVADQSTLLSMPLNSDMSTNPTPLSPRHPTGPLSRSGLLSADWAAKLFLHVPAAALVFLPINPPTLPKRIHSPSRSPSLNIVDESFFSMLRTIKSSVTRAGGGRTWACLVVPDSAHLDAEWVNDCVSFVRRELGLDRQSCLVMALDFDVSELVDHVASTIFESIMKHYAKKAARISQKRAQVPEIPSVLTQTAWHIRYDVKQSYLASVRGDYHNSFIIALKAYTTLTSKYLSFSSHAVCVNDSVSGLLVDPETLKGNPDSAPLIVFGQRWYEARHLTDVLVLIMLRALILGVTSKNLSPGHLIRTHINMVLPQLPDGPHSAPSAAWACYDHSAAFMSFLALIIPTSQSGACSRYTARLFKSLGHPSLFWVTAARFSILADPVAEQSIPAIKLLPMGPVILCARAATRQSGLARVYYTRALFSTATGTHCNNNHLALVSMKVSEEASDELVPLATEALFCLIKQFNYYHFDQRSYIAGDAIHRLIKSVHRTREIESSEYVSHWAKVELEARFLDLISLPDSSTIDSSSIPIVAQQMMSEHVVVPLDKLAESNTQFDPEIVGVEQTSDLIIKFTPKLKLELLVNTFLSAIVFCVSPDEYSFVLEHDSSNILSLQHDSPQLWSKSIKTELRKCSNWRVQFKPSRPALIKILSVDYIFNFGAKIIDPRPFVDNTSNPEPIQSDTKLIDTGLTLGIDSSTFGQLVLRHELCPSSFSSFNIPSSIELRNTLNTNLRVLPSCWDLELKILPMSTPILVDEPSLVRIHVGSENKVLTSLSRTVFVVIWIPPGSIPTGIEPCIEFFPVVEITGASGSLPDFSQPRSDLLSIPVTKIPSLVQLYIRARRSSPAPIMLAVNMSDTDPNADDIANHIHTGLTPTMSSPVSPTPIPLNSPKDRSLSALLAPMYISQPDASAPSGPQIPPLASAGRQWTTLTNSKSTIRTATTLPYHPLASFTASFSVSPIQHVPFKNESAKTCFTEHRVLLMDIAPAANVPIQITHLELVDHPSPPPHGVTISLTVGPTPVQLKVDSSWRVVILVSILLDCPTRVLLGKIKVHWCRSEAIGLETIVPLPVIQRVPMPIVIETECPLSAMQYSPLNLAFIVHNVSTVILRVQIAIEVGTKTTTNPSGDNNSTSASTSSVAHIAGDRVLNVVLMPSHVYRIPLTAIPLIPGSVDIAQCVVTIPVDDNNVLPSAVNEPIVSLFAKVCVVPEKILLSGVRLG